MAARDIIVVGASAGGVSALKAFVKSLPKNFEGIVLIVLHIPAYSKSRLPTILGTAADREVVHPEDGDKLVPGSIYVAPNDHHMLVEKNNTVAIKRGPKENRFRPSIDALFRSAAFVYGTRVIGIVLSGLLNDGTSGLWTIKRHGGVVIIQEPEDAEYPEMPVNVLEYVDVDHIVPAPLMGGLLESLTVEPATEKHKFSKEELKRLEMEVIIATKDNAFEMGIMDLGELTVFTCPECHGALARLVEGKLIRYRCHTGHAYTASSLLASLTESVEELLWQSMRAMEETTMLLENIGKHFHEIKNEKKSKVFFEKAKKTARSAQVIHDSIFTLDQYSEDIGFEKR
jgi:two-component system, chemotaxis family, protein-glutamate methylesterase/glutaminase